MLLVCLKINSAGMKHQLQVKLFRQHTNALKIILSQSRVLQMYNVEEHLLQRIYKENQYDFDIYSEYWKKHNVIWNQGRNLEKSDSVSKEGKLHHLRDKS